MGAGYVRLRRVNRQPTFLSGGQPFLLSGSDALGCVVVHGYTGSPGNMRWLGNDLHKRLGATIYAPRLAGHGTRPEDIRGMHWEEWYADAMSAYCMLRERCDRVFMIGLSMGAALSLMVAANHAVDGVVAMSTPFNIYDWRVRLLPLLKLIAPYRTKAETADSLKWREFVHLESQKRADPFGYASYDRYPTSSLIEVNELLAAMRDALPRIQAPTLLIHSQRDDVVPYPHLQHTIDALTGTAPQVVTLEKSLHVITMDCETDSVFGAIADFIRETDSSPRD